MNKKLLLSGVVAIVAIAIVVTALLTSAYYTSLSIYGSAGIDFELHSIHATVTMLKDGKPYFSYSHPGSMTNLGANLTMTKLTGNVSNAYNGTTYMMNTTWVSIGNDTGTLGVASTVLPGEWNRTTAVMHNCTYNSFNLTAVFTGASASQTADCISINYETGIGNGALWGYDTFTEVTGIDSTFTITIEFKISVS